MSTTDLHDDALEAELATIRYFTRRNYVLGIMLAVPLVWSGATLVFGVPSMYGSRSAWTVFSIVSDLVWLDATAVFVYGLLHMLLNRRLGVFSRSAWLAASCMFGLPFLAYMWSEVLRETGVPEVDEAPSGELLSAF